MTKPKSTPKPLALSRNTIALLQADDLKQVAAARMKLSVVPCPG